MHLNCCTQGNFLWPGYGENSRVLDWIFRRTEGEDCAQSTPIGYIPKPGALNLTGLKDNVDMNELFSIPKDFWLQEVSPYERLHHIVYYSLQNEPQ